MRNERNEISKRQEHQQQQQHKNEEKKINKTKTRLHAIHEHEIERCLNIVIWNPTTNSAHQSTRAARSHVELFIIFGFK